MPESSKMRNNGLSCSQTHDTTEHLHTTNDHASMRQVAGVLLGLLLRFLALATRGLGRSLASAGLSSYKSCPTHQQRTAGSPWLSRFVLSTPARNRTRLWTPASLPGASEHCALLEISAFRPRCADRPKISPKSLQFPPRAASACWRRRASQNRNNYLHDLDPCGPRVLAMSRWPAIW